MKGSANNHVNWLQLKNGISIPCEEKFDKTLANHSFGEVHNLWTL